MPPLPRRGGRFTGLPTAGSATGLRPPPATVRGRGGSLIETGEPACAISHSSDAPSADGFGGGCGSERVVERVAPQVGELEHRVDESLRVHRRRARLARRLLLLREVVAQFVRWQNYLGRR